MKYDDIVNNKEVLEYYERGKTIWRIVFAESQRPESSVIIVFE